MEASYWARILTYRERVLADIFENLSALNNFTNDFIHSQKGKRINKTMFDCLNADIYVRKGLSKYKLS